VIAYLLQHIHHGINSEPEDVVHRSEGGDVIYDEDLDDFKIIGIFSSMDAVAAARNQLKEAPGFRDEPECFIVSGYTMDDVNWTDGYVTLGPDD
jgi:hypothetical protein